MTFARLIVVVMLPLALVWGVPEAQAAGQCTDLAATNVSAYRGCVTNLGANCNTRNSGIGQQHVVCIYPDGGRDDCNYQMIGGPTLTCQYFPPGA